MQEIPFAVTGLGFDNGGEFLNRAVINWAAERDIYFTRSRPYRRNDQATIESKNNHLVRRYAFYFRYDTDEERHALNRLWKLVNDRLNYLTPTIKPVGWGENKAGRRKTPLSRLLAAGTRSPTQARELTAFRDGLNPAALARQDPSRCFVASPDDADPTPSSARGFSQHERATVAAGRRQGRLPAESAELPTAWTGCAAWPRSTSP